jgi:hypothetical protein
MVLSLGGSQRKYKKMELIPFLRSGRAGLVTAPRLPLALEPPALCLPATGILAPAKGRLCDDWYFLWELLI